jgi:hypothetical protein
MRPAPRTRSRILAALLPAALLAACGGGGGGGGGGSATTAEVEPNDTFATATPLTLNTAGTGDATTGGDVDYWSIALTGGTFVKVELFGTRRDQATWDTNANVPNIILYDTDGTTMAYEHDYTGNLPGGAWSWGFHDLDMPLIQVPATGTYFIAISQDDPLLPGGTYAIKVSTVSVTGQQVEA